jgi:hypothetical protein
MNLILVVVVICGGLILRGIGRVNYWLDHDYINRPQFLNRNPNLATFLVILANITTYPSAILLGWKYSGWIVALITAFAVFIAQIVVLFLIDRCLPPRISYRFPLNPIVHLFVLPPFLLVLDIVSLLHH